jgi:hypothetical protein
MALGKACVSWYKWRMEKTKKCTKCGAEKPLCSYHRSKAGRLGRVAKCKTCVKEYNATPERRAAIKASGAANRAATERKYKRSEKGKAIQRKCAKARRKKHPEKMRAKDKVKYAVRIGRLVRQPCEVCGSTTNVHAHHDDYSKPLDVRWLCYEHHMEVHKDD